MAPTACRPLAIFYEHPDWFRPLFQELDRRGVDWVPLDAARHRYDPAAPAPPPYSLVFNRMSPSAFLRGGSHAVFYTTQYLDHLERVGTRVVNGVDAWRTEISKARQLTLLRRLGLRTPPTRVVGDPERLSEAAAELRFPVVVKPNIGGSGAGIRRFETPDELDASAGTLDFGIDRTALVQEVVPAEQERIVRVEVLDGRFLYAIRIYTPGDSFNLCPADVCRTVDGSALERTACPADAPDHGLRVEAYEPPPGIVRDVERVMAAAGIELGGVEYMIDVRDGQPCFYDVNALSNFVADAPRVLGFDPFSRLADWLVQEAGAAATPTQEND